MRAESGDLWNQGVGLDSGYEASGLNGRPAKNCVCATVTSFDAIVNLLMHK